MNATTITAAVIAAILILAGSVAIWHAALTNENQ